MNRDSYWIAYFIFFFYFTLGCTSNQPELIVYGKDACSHCKMLISDKRFGAEAVTKKGKVYKFDSIECMLDFAKTNSEKLGPEYREYIVDTTKNGELIPVEKAHFFEDKKLRSPMGRGFIVSLNKEELAKIITNSSDGEIFGWSQLKERVK